MLLHKGMSLPVLRLGNNFYKIGFSIMAKARYGADTAYPNYWLWEYLKNSVPIDPGYEADVTWDIHTWDYDQEAADKFATEFVTKNVDIGIGSFFQSFKWFDPYADEMLRFFEFKPEYEDPIREKYKEALSRKTIGISIRRGDFVGHGVFYQIPLNWYTEALEAEFPDWRDCNVVFFSDDIEELKKIFKGDNFYFAEPNDTFHTDEVRYHAPAPEQFILGTMMDNYIVSQSTFAMAIAWLGYRRNGGKVVHSGRHLERTHLASIGAHGKDYYPDYWIEHPC